MCSSYSAHMLTLSSTTLLNFARIATWHAKQASNHSLLHSDNRCKGYSMSHDTPEKLGAASFATLGVMISAGAQPVTGFAVSTASKPPSKLYRVKRPRQRTAAG